MARVTESDVREIIQAPSTLALTAFITAANVMINSQAAMTVLDADLLKEIERWLAAHFTAIRVQQLASQDIGDGKDSYQYKVDLGLRSTMYGQQAIAMDTSGSLDKLNRQKKSVLFETIDISLTSDEG